MKSCLTALTLLGVATLTPSARAYCRTTTCDPNASCETEPEACCVLDEDWCDTRGIPLAWPSACVSYAVQKDGSPLREISAEETSTLIDKAFAAWMRASCGEGTGPNAAGATPNVELENLGFVSCGEPAFDFEGRNANVWMFRDDGWDRASGSGSSGPLDPGTLALTTVSYNIRTGRIYDADVEFNSARMQLVLDAGPGEIDLPSIATHEAGHFLGLDHSLDPRSTMRAGYTPGDTELRTLAPDDERGICAIYPTDREIDEDASCSPFGGFVSDCAPSCSLDPSRPGRALSGAGLLAAILVGLGLRRRVRSVHSA